MQWSDSPHHALDALDAEPKQGVDVCSLVVAPDEVHVLRVLNLRTKKKEPQRLATTLRQALGPGAAETSPESEESLWHCVTIQFPYLEGSSRMMVLQEQVVYLPTLLRCHYDTVSLYLEGEQQDDGLQAVLPSIHVVSQEQVVYVPAPQQHTVGEKPAPE